MKCDIPKLSVDVTLLVSETSRAAIGQTISQNTVSQCVIVCLFVQPVLLNVSSKFFLQILTAAHTVIDLNLSII